MSLSESQAAVAASAKVIYAATTRSYAYAPWSLADQEPFLRAARAALEAAEAAQGSGEPSPCAGCGGDGVQIDDDPESTRQIVSTCGECRGSGSEEQEQGR